MQYYRDGIELEIEGKPKVYTTRDGHVVEEYISEGEKGYFVTLNGLPFCAHGSTLSEAISDATWKDASKRPSLESLKEEIIKAGKDRLINLNEFRLLTGACREGCIIALKRAKLDGSPMTAFDIYKHFPDWGGRLLDVLGWKYD
jgi:hypothetical protein